MDSQAFVVHSETLLNESARSYTTMYADLETALKSITTADENQQRLINIKEHLKTIRLPMPPPDIEAYLLTMTNTDDDPGIDQLFLNEQKTRATVRLRQLYFTTLKVNYIQCEKYMLRQVANQEVDIYLEVIIKATRNMMRDCEKLREACQKYAGDLEVVLLWMNFD